MQVDLGTVVAAIATILSIASMIIVTLGKITVANREKDIDRRIEDTSKKTDAIDLRLHGEEKATIRQDGEIRMVRQHHEGVTDDINEIKRNMITKVEWVQLEKVIDRLTSAVERRPGYGGAQHSSSQYTSLGSQTSPPKKSPER